MTINVQDASFAYPDGTTALENINLSFTSGERVAIIGQNGAGKTTLAKLMNGLLVPTSGSVIVDGKATTSQSTAKTARSVGYVFQNPDDQIFSADVMSELRYMPKYFGWSEEETNPRIARAVRLTGIRPYVDENPGDLPFAIKKFVAIASVLVNGCDHVILDEPTAGLDGAGTERLVGLLESLAEQGTTVITITHDMRFVVDAFPRVVVMANRQVVADGQARDVFGSDTTLAAAQLRRPESAQLVRDIHPSSTALAMGDIVRELR